MFVWLRVFACLHHMTTIRNYVNQFYCIGFQSEHPIPLARIIGIIGTTSGGMLLETVAQHRGYLILGVPHVSPRAELSFYFLYLSV